MEFEFEIDHAQPCGCERCTKWFKRMKLVRTMIAERDKARITQGPYKSGFGYSMKTHGGK